MRVIALHSVVPVRAEAREGSEQNTQMLFGEIATVLETQPRWMRIRLEGDNQEGWVDAKMVASIGGKDYTTHHQALKDAAYVIMPMAYAMSENNGQTIPLTAGTRLTRYEIKTEEYNGRQARIGRFEVLGVGFRIDPGMVIANPLDLNEQNLLKVTRFFLNVPYLWGGKNAMGMDCSGFTQVILSLFGKHLLRNASEQATQGRAIAGLKKAKAGDLAFFDHEDGRISHVGIVIDSERLIHCSGRVKVEKLDETGIFSVEQGGYSHHLVAIRRY